MREKICISGEAVALLRKKHPSLARQKSLAHELGISVRKLRDIETTNGPWDKSLALQIAKCLSCSLDEIVFSAVGPRLVLAPTVPRALAPTARRFRGKELYPRHGKESASAVGDADSFFTSANRADRVIVQNSMELTDELSGYVEELIELARISSGERNPYPYSLVPEDPRVPAIKARMQWLLTWLKGSDVHVFVCDHTKFLPEHDEVPEGGKWDAIEWHAVIAIAPPQEWNETTVDVDVDHGRPYIIDWDADFTCPTATPF
jgi:hypothetical protein